MQNKQNKNYIYTNIRLYIYIVIKIIINER